MIIFGHTPREEEKAKEHKWFIAAIVISFV